MQLFSNVMQRMMKRATVHVNLKKYCHNILTLLIKKKKKKELRINSDPPFNPISPLKDFVGKGATAVGTDYIALAVS